MAGRASAFAVLGLEPGADAAAVEKAYKRLIKLHHPDRDGGDATRAAEITQAYRELRGGKARMDPLEFNDDYAAMRRPPRWPVAALVAGACIGGLVLLMGPSVPHARALWAATPLSPHHEAHAAASADPMADGLHIGAIDAAVAEALRIYRTKDEFTLATASRECQSRFRDEPGTRMLDRCAAFDDAVVGLQDRDPLRDAGPFAPLAVTGRQWSAASTLSDDYLAIDSRLDQVRLRVEVVLVPQVPPIAPAEGNSVD
jgi:hypothetical protein